MDCNKIISLYLKGYISDEKFENIFYDYIDDFQNSVEEDIYLNILFTNFSHKEEKISLETELRNYVLKNYKSLYENINDAYVERLIDSNNRDVVTEILRKKYEKKKEITIECSKISTGLELINAFRQVFKYTKFCGNNWYAIEDLIYDVIFPEKLVFNNWSEVERKLPQDTVILKAVLDRNCNDRCIIIYV